MIDINLSNKCAEDVEGEGEQAAEDEEGKLKGSGWKLRPPPTCQWAFPTPLASVALETCTSPGSSLTETRSGHIQNGAPSRGVNAVTGQG